MNVAVGASYAVELFLGIVCDSGNETFSDKRHRLLLDQAEVVIVEFNLSSKLLESQNFACITTIDRLRYRICVVAFVNRSLSLLKSIEFFSFDPCYLVLNLLPTLFSAFDCVRGHGVYDVLHELPPFHLAVPVDVNFLEQLVTAINEFIFFIIVFRKYMVDHQLYEL